MSDIASNKLAHRDYDIREKFDAGLVLSGQEVKSVRAGHMKLTGAYGTITRGQVWLIGSHVPAYKPAGPLPAYDPNRSRKILLHRREIGRLAQTLGEKGLTLVPIRVYTLRGKLKLELGLGRGRREFEKRDVIRKREIDREIHTALKRDR